MEKIYVSSAETGIIYNSDILLFDYFMKNGNFLEFPGLQVSKDIIKNTSDFTLNYYNSLEKSLKCTDYSMEINYPLEEVNESSIIYPGYIMLEKARLQNKSVSCHSACIEKNDDGILLLGKIGSGKTTTAINLCKNYGYNLISNDVTILKDCNKELQAIDGTKFLFLRYESIRRNIPELISLFENKNVDINYGKNNEVDNWRKKVRVLPSEVNINCCDKSVPITSIYMLHIDENQNELYVARDESLATRLELNETFSSTIRGTKTTFRNKDNIESLYIPSLDTKEHYELRRKIIKKMLEDIKIEYLSGNINDVSEYISERKKIIRR